MATATAVQAPTVPFAVHTRLVSFENSNSWIKRHDSAGTTVIQAGYRLNPSKMAHADNENPIVIEGSEKRWYGTSACQGTHTRAIETSKIASQRSAFAACLQPADDGKDLIVIAAHHSQDEFNAISRTLVGQYRVIRNGVAINCTVTKVIPVLEGMGAYHGLKPRLEPGQTLAIEIGFGTSENWLINAQGQIIDGFQSTKISVSNLVDLIAADQSIIAAGGGYGSSSVNKSLLSLALKEDTFGSLTKAQWTSIKTRYAKEFVSLFKSEIKASFGHHMAAIDNLVLSGGGAAILSACDPGLSEFFTIAPTPQLASVVGSYNHQMALVGQY